MKQPQRAPFVALFQELRGMVSNQALREILLAAYGHKVARLCIAEEQIPTLTRSLESAALWVDLHNVKQVHAQDSGKGGWISASGLEVPIESAQSGYLYLYVGSDPEKVLAARKAEHAPDHDVFGTLLGYPACCIDFYKKNLADAEKEQGDFMLPLLAASLKQRTGALPIFPAWTNIAAQYFGYGLLSFYPCSFCCPEARSIAEQSFALLKRYDREFADNFLETAKQPVLYTEYEGIYLFRGATLRGVCLHYDPSLVERTLDGVLSAMIQASNRIDIDSAHRVTLRKGRCLTGRLESPYLGIFLFA